MSEQPTLRAIHERCKTRHSPYLSGSGECYGCGGQWPCPDYSDAVAALALMEKADDLLDDIRLECGSNTFGGVRHQSEAIKTLNALLGDPLSCPEVPAETRDGETT